MSPSAVGADQVGMTLAAFVRGQPPAMSWAQARKAVVGRRVRLNGELVMDPARRLKEGDLVEVLAQPQRASEAIAQPIVVRYLDEHIVVVEKPAGISTTRHPAERDWPARRRELSPTLDDRVQKQIAVLRHVPLHKLPRLRKVHRLDKLTSGLLVFARSPLAERELGRQFHAHTVDRLYQAVVHGRLSPQTIRSWLVRDRGDGKRGSARAPNPKRVTTNKPPGKLAVTHVEKVEPLGQFSLVTCRLETGRTHQIRIHLAEIGHAVCGDPVYGSNDVSGAPRLALHAAELGFRHPATAQECHWSMPLPKELRAFIDRLRKEK